MSDEQIIRDELIQVLSEQGAEYGGRLDEVADVGGIADAILASPVIRRMQAEALREAVRSAEADHEGDPLAHIWDRADRIERGKTA